MITRRPKFKLDLSINELSNIPQVSGHCFIELQIHDTKKPWSLGLGKLSLKNDDDDKTVRHGSAGNVGVATSAKKIHNFKCSFNYRLSCNLKFGVKRRENLIDNKYLTMKVYYVSEKSHHNHNKLLLGRLEINLAEYLNFSDPLTSKYLLKESKVNSILSVSIHLTELGADENFRTQLQISDRPSDSHLDRQTRSASGGYKVPQFERKNIFGGLNDVISDKSGKTTPPTSNNSSGKSVSSDDEKRRRKKHQPPSQPNTTHEEGFQPIVDPIVNNLYKKILESTWDQNLHKLLDFTPEVCINHIFEDDAEKWRRRLKEDLDHNDEDYEVRCVHGLVNEANYRDDLRSWTVHEVPS